LEDLHTIVQNALVEQQAHLQAGYDNILQQRLAEQFQSFTKFNEDHIHRQLKQRFVGDALLHFLLYC
jgi:hypothetical protein